MKYLLVIFAATVLLSCKKNVDLLTEPSITLLSPDSTATIRPGDQITITWKSNRINKETNVTIVAWYKPYENILMPWYVAETKNSGSITVHAPIDAHAGIWQMRIVSGLYSDQKTFIVQN